MALTNQSADVHVQVSQGPVRGRREGPDARVAAFRGVPYAAPPTGPLRFAPPAEPPPWHEPLDAAGPRGTVPLQLPSPVGTLMADPQTPQTEACLTVNIWTPGPGGRARPVLVWLPGGSFLTGGADLPRYDGAELAAQENLVVVLVNYRLGALGFLAPHEAEPATIEGTGTQLTFRTASPDGFTTNAGLLDQIAALRWIRAEITAFGGDPERIAVAGQSAGGQALAALLALPQVRPLFRRALLHSAPLGMAPLTRQAAAETADLFRTAAGAAGPQQLRTASAEQIRAAQQHILTRPRPPGDVRPPFQLVADTTVVAADLTRALRHSPPLDGTEILLGTTRHECALWFGRQTEGPDREAVLAQFRAEFGPRADEALARYTAAAPAPSQALTAAFEDLKTDAFFAAPTQDFADTLHTHGARTWLYRFDWQLPGRHQALRACHCLDIPFLLGREEARHAPLFEGTDQNTMTHLRRQMRALWGAFVRTGTPAPHTNWPAHHPDRPAIRTLGATPADTIRPSLLEPGREELWQAHTGTPDAS
ncbi:carboxylesterase/lipase family protein [Streptomyces pinistramenti]|uniref:carboxylesterase/lipase family protein n=1 Tax=Streptomyces pinistramenti TaxID=2884812 RepID=UPI001D076FB0|nr:carboxylesterase family protein [Streptomyces pinistramenti]MCB5910442.1 carboxylesterase family protein [Streptomyces pinistramenti]